MVQCASKCEIAALVDKDDREVQGWIPHDQIILIGNEERPPPETQDDRDYTLENNVNGRQYYASFPWAET